MIRYVVPVVVIFLAAHVRGQTPAGDEMGVFRGVQVDSPRLFLAWKSSAPSADDHFKDIRIGYGDTIITWDSPRLFGLPMDSISVYFQTESRLQRAGFHRIYLYFKPDNTVQLKALFNQYFGPTVAERGAQTAFVYHWRTRYLRAYMSSRRRFGAKPGAVVAYIELPYYL